MSDKNNGHKTGLIPIVHNPRGIRRSSVHLVVESTVRCPKCKSKKTKVTSTRLPIRYRKCMNESCGINFKTVEID